MLRHFFLISYRVIRKHSAFSFINILGLALGIVCSLLIGLYIHAEFSFDHFHQKGDRLYRVYIHDETEGSFFKMFHHISGQLGEEAGSVPDIEACIRTKVYKSGYCHIFRGEKRFAEEQILAADTSFFEAFDYPLLMGNAADVLDKKHQIVISESFAQKCFGAEDPIGKTIGVQAREASQDYLVAGVMKDIPSHTHFKFDVIVPFTNHKFLDQSPMPTDQYTWGTLNYETFLLTRKPVTDYLDMEEKLSSLLPESQTYQMAVQPFKDIHLARGKFGPKPEREIQTLYIFGLIASIILLIACINYMNLSTARASTRRLEVSVRKVLGARPRQLFRQFMGEALLHTLIAFLLAFLITDLSLPIFEHFFDLKLNLKPLFTSSGILYIFLSLLLISFLGGTYPAIFLAQQAGNLLKNFRKGSSKTGHHIRKALVVVQFLASILLIISTLVIYRQMDYVLTKDLGYDQEKVLYIPLSGAGSPIDRHVLKEAFLQLPEVKAASNTSLILGQGSMRHGVKLNKDTEKDHILLDVVAVEAGYVESLNLRLTSGHAFRTDHITDLRSGMVVNEAFVKKFDLEDPLGEEIFRNGQVGKIIGVVEDFHFTSLKTQIEPILMYIDTSSFQHYQYSTMVLKLEKGDIRDQLKKVENAWLSLAPNRPFVYRFQDEIIEKMYEEERTLGRLMSSFSLLAVIIASLGLLGLVTFTAAQRSKEIGIRKVLGASLTDIILMLSRSYFLLLGLAFLIAIPLSVYLMNNWLENFAYRISLEFWIFALAALFAITITGLTAGFQSYKAASINPADALRDE